MIKKDVCLPGTELYALLMRIITPLKTFSLIFFSTLGIELQALYRVRALLLSYIPSKNIFIFNRHIMTLQIYR